MFYYPTDHTASAAEEKQKMTAAMLYAAAQPVFKRNMLYVMQPGLPNITAEWVPKPDRGCLMSFRRRKTDRYP